MKFFWTECDKYSSGTSSQNRIKPGMFLEIEIPLPSIEEQMRLVEILDKYNDQLSIISDYREKALNDFYHLKNSILQEAVQGNLVPQDTNDEPASVLLEKIRVEKEQLIKEKKIKNEKPLPEITEDEILYKLPQGWKWVRFRDIAEIASNLVDPNDFLELIHIAPDNIEKGNGKLLDYKTIKDSVTSAKHYFYRGQILYSKIRPNLSKLIIAPFNGLCSADMYPINSLIDTNYLFKYMLSQTFLSMSTKTDTRVAMPKINQESLNKITVPIPPLNEQKRIVEKVDQLMTLCDELEKTVEQSKQDSELLMQSVLQEVFQLA